jgi:hypothetical protein
MFEKKIITYTEAEMGTPKAVAVIAVAIGSLICQAVNALNLYTYIQTGGKNWGPPGWPLPWKAFCGVYSLATYAFGAAALWTKIMKYYD